MNFGAWHQLGDRSQRFVLELLSEGAGVGVIISPRDLASERATEYAAQYRELGAEVLIDPQFYYPEFTNTRIASYSLAEHRRDASTLTQITDAELALLASNLIQFNSSVEASAVIAPAVVSEAGRQDLVELNQRLHSAGLLAARELKIPVYGSVMLSRSITRNSTQLMNALSHATSVRADGWYFGCQFDNERIVSSRDDIFSVGRGPACAFHIRQAGFACLCWSPGTSFTWDGSCRSWYWSFPELMALWQAKVAAIRGRWGRR